MTGGLFAEGTFAAAIRRLRRVVWDSGAMRIFFANHHIAEVREFKF